MIRLNLKKKPVWIDVGCDVKIKVLPLTTPMMVLARKSQTVKDLAEDASDEERAIVFAVALACLVIKSWKGVENETGESADVTPESISALMDIWPIFDAFQEKYVVNGLVLDQEKNA